MTLNLPNVLTLLRVAAIPVLVLLCYLGPPLATFWAAGVFLLAAITDWLDGWLARRTGQMTAFGAFLDPVADKLMVATTLVVLVERFASPWITVAAAVVIGREILVSALREWMAQIGQHASVRVNLVAKIKTALQMSAIIVLLLIPKSGTDLLLYKLGLVMLFVAVVLTLWSMVLYLQAFARALADAEKAESE